MGDAGDEHGRIGCRGLSRFLSEHEAALVVLSGRARGQRLPLDQLRVSLGRGPGVDLTFDDPQLAREHAVIEFAEGAYHVTGLDPRTPVLLNGVSGGPGTLKPGDRIEIGAHRFEYEQVDRTALHGATPGAQ